MAPCGYRHQLASSICTGRCDQVGAEQGYPGGFPAGILLDSDGTLWVKTRTSGLSCFCRAANRSSRRPNTGEGLTTRYAFLHEAPDGCIWLSDDQGLRRVAGQLSAPALRPPSDAISEKPCALGDFTFAPGL